MREFVLQQFKQNSNGQKLDGMDRDLNEPEMLSIAYYQGVVRYLVKSGLLQDSEALNIDFIVSSSTPQEDDYV